MHKNGTVFKLNVKPKFSEVEGEIAGIFAGDGSQYFESKSYYYEVNIHFGKQNLKYAHYVKNLFETFFDKKFRLEKQNPNCLRLRTYSKEIYYFFKNYLQYIPQVKHSTVKLKSLNFPTKFKIGFLRGICDTDGHIRQVNKHRTRVIFCTTSQELSRQISVILFKLGITNVGYVSVRKHRKNEKPVYYIGINKDFADKFIKIIKPLKARTEKGR